VKQIISKDKLKEVFATLGFIALLILGTWIIGYIISSVTIQSHPSNIKTEKECRDKGFAWHSVDGCFTQEMFINEYVD
jgi:hypothetical protein